jgi:phosphatidylglycerophosphatase A
VTLKESSDELNQTKVVADQRVPVSTRRTASDYLALAIATCGVGYFPIAPGTLGALVGVAVFVTLRWGLIRIMVGPVISFDAELANPRTLLLPLELVSILVITILGIWAASRTERILGLKDPGKVVVDEVAGQMISLLPLIVIPGWPGTTWIIVSFLLFRFFDIVKPYPARRFEALHGGVGIMADDLVAGVYAALATVVLMGIFGVLS